MKVVVLFTWFRWLKGEGGIIYSCYMFFSRCFKGCSAVEFRWFIKYKLCLVWCTQEVALFGFMFVQLVEAFQWSRVYPSRNVLGPMASIFAGATTVEQFD